MIDCKHYKEVELFYDPVDISGLLPIDLSGMEEMSAEQQGFICGLIKKYRPKKLLEIGVSAGGTTAVLLHCLHMLGLNTDVYSCDLCREWYIDKNKKVGFVGEYVREKINYSNYTLFTGDTIAAYIDAIGTGIDFLLLDAAHNFPGEILDFLLCLPYLSRNAVVVLHDVLLNHQAKNAYSCFVTRTLFDVVNAEKFYIFDKSWESMKNIAAFRVDDRTRSDVVDVISSLYYTWQYYPTQKQVKDCINVFAKHYDAACMDMFFDIFAKQKALVESSQIEIRIKRHLERCYLSKLRESGLPILIYGCGNAALDLCQWLRGFGLQASAAFVSDGRPVPEGMSSLLGMPVFTLDAVRQMYSDAYFILGTYEKQTSHEMKNELYKYGYTHII